MNDNDPVRYCLHGNQLGKCDTCELIAAEKRIAELETAIHEASEIYIGMEGFIPRNCEAAYTLRIIKQMYDALKEGE